MILNLNLFLFKIRSQKGVSRGDSRLRPTPSQAQCRMSEHVIAQVSDHLPAVPPHLFIHHTSF